MELELIKFAQELGLTPDFGVMAFLAYQMYKINRDMSRVLYEHDKRISIMESKGNG